MAHISQICIKWHEDNQTLGDQLEGELFQIGSYYGDAADNGDIEEQYGSQRLRLNVTLATVKIESLGGRQISPKGDLGSGSLNIRISYLEHETFSIPLDAFCLRCSLDFYHMRATHRRVDVTQAFQDLGSQNQVLFATLGINLASVPSANIKDGDRCPVSAGCRNTRDACTFPTLKN